MRYILIKTTCENKFNRQINEKLDEGWQLHGDTFIYKTYKDQEAVTYTQALIKKETNPDFLSVEQMIASWNV